MRRTNEYLAYAIHEKRLAIKDQASEIQKAIENVQTQKDRMDQLLDELNHLKWEQENMKLLKL